ncbi:FAD-dependent monooxygenase [Neobacillus ginsengisoli]|uniref:2-polyprenyl-6-methoxyphenol hydroxylase-like FAD-dependent oxidoreductase n=1 Tax=Neobacillus ginsengisoli TaxID=904295 RepID=A0ABT9XRT2_9BACI|nr:FAD-dependent monooxygenase [Neobacillus ginsengisoli]MDQ0198248.1 2-polyprenyl-6-methoxyphenol hydroxylase-like FAD-dependent oxidoreductase [Neobacillus ginsengisoli]
MKILSTDVCIVGGGPAGMIMALLLAKQKVNVMVVERNVNFDREFRGEVLQPRFVQMLEQLNLRSYIESYPHLKLKHGAIMKESAQIGEFNFSAIDSKFPYAMWMPQPILLQALYKKCQEYPTFSIHFHTKVQHLLKEGERVKGVITKNALGEELEIQAKITIGADGRFSTIRQLGGFELEYDFYENDLIWFTIPHPKDMDNTLRFYMSKPIYLVLPKYPDLMQIGLAFPKEKWKEIRGNGIEKFRGTLKELNPLFQSFAEGLQDFKSFTVLNSRVQYVKEWAKDGCLLIGDAAHCASPVGAMGVSLSVATAIVAADVVWKGLNKQDISQEWLSQVQTIRSPEIRLFHRSQIRIEKLAIRYTPWLKTIGGTLIPLFVKTKFALSIQRKIFLMPKSLPIDSSFVFEN